MITNTDSCKASAMDSPATCDCVALANADVANGVSAKITFAAGLDGETITTQTAPSS